MSDVETIADLAQRIGEELAADAVTAFEGMCIANHEPPPTERERILIRVLSLQLASAIANVLEKMP
jgi:hypothetical protein